MLRLQGTKAVPPNYEKDFLKADYTFLYQLVFDPVTEALTPLNSIPDDLQDEDLSFAGQYPSFLCRFKRQVGLFV
jgi:exonuclease-1